MYNIEDKHFIDALAASHPEIHNHLQNRVCLEVQWKLQRILPELLRKRRDVTA